MSFEIRRLHAGRRTCSPYPKFNRKHEAEAFIRLCGFEPSMWRIEKVVTGNKLSPIPASEEKGSPSNKGISGEIQRAEPKS